MKIIIDSCAFDQYNAPEDAAAEILLDHFRQGKVNMLITHSAEKEKAFPNTPDVIKKIAARMAQFFQTAPTPQEKELLTKLQGVLAAPTPVHDVAADSNNLLVAYRYSAVFLTADEKLLDKKDEISALCSLKVMRPSEVLPELQEKPEEDFLA
jgi:hypothetical protein